jgi:hypothetical protein
MKSFKLVILLSFLPVFVWSQPANEVKTPSIIFSGFVKNDVFFDSRQTVSIREGHFLLYPAHESLDMKGNDINARSNFNMLAIQSRLTGKINGPDAFGAKTSGIIEGAFFGQSDPDINGFRLRHAYMELKWDKKELLMGQYWNAMFIPESFPDVVSFNTGAPFQPFARNPQVRYTQHFGNLKLYITAMTERDFASFGGSASLRNSAIPIVNGKVIYSKKNEDKKQEFLVGAMGDFKILQPRLVSTKNYITDQTVTGLSASAFIKARFPKVSIKLQGVYGQNLYDLTMLGGYALKATSDSNIINNDLFEYTTLNVFSAWTDIATTGTTLQTGLFIGYTENHGSAMNIQDFNKSTSYFSRGANIDYIYRIAPRLIWNSGKTRLSAEAEYTVAAYGNILNNDSLGRVTDSKEIANLRILLAAYYFF